LASIAPALRSDLQQYVDARDATSRHRGGPITMLRSLAARLRPRLDDRHTFRSPNCAERWTRFHDNGWCEKQQPVATASRDRSDASVIPKSCRARVPAFVSDDERTATAQERSALDAAGSARSYLASETLAWAADEPKNPVVAEALDRGVKGWRVGCGDD
jgi:hypothetical protein